jgi:hypothetical protein
VRKLARSGGIERLDTPKPTNIILMNERSFSQAISLVNSNLVVSSLNSPELEPSSV